MDKIVPMAANSLDNESLDSSRLHVMATGLATHRMKDRVNVHAVYCRILAAPGLRIHSITEIMHALYVEVPVDSTTKVVRDERR